MPNSKSAPMNATLYRASFKTKHFEVLRPNLPHKNILGTEFTKTIVKFSTVVNCRKQLSNSKSAHLNTPFKALWSFETKFAQKKVLQRRKSKKLFLNSKSAALNTLCIEFHFTQSTVEFGTKFGQKSIFGTKLRKIKCPSILFWAKTNYQVLGHSGS